MLPYTLIDPNAAFSKAFITVGMHWAAYVVAVGALLGIVTGVRLPPKCCALQAPGFVWLLCVFESAVCRGPGAVLTCMALHRNSLWDLHEVAEVRVRRRAGVLVGSLAVTRGVTALGRENFLPPLAAVVSHRLGTPIFATAILGVATGVRLQRRHAPVSPKEATRARTAGCPRHACPVIVQAVCCPAQPPCV